MIKRRRKNPNDNDLLNDVEIEKILLYNDTRILYIVYKINGFVKDDSLVSSDFAYHIKFVYNIDIRNTSNILAVAIYNTDQHFVEYIRTNKNYKRKGLASYLYNHIEKDQKVKLKPSNSLEPDGQKFWENRMKRNPIKRKRNPTEIYMIHKDNQGFLDIEKGSETKIAKLANHFPNSLILDRKELKELFGILESYV